MGVGEIHPTGVLVSVGVEVMMMIDCARVPSGLDSRMSSRSAAAKAVREYRAGLELDGVNRIAPLYSSFLHFLSLPIVAVGLNECNGEFA